MSDRDDDSDEAPRPLWPYSLFRRLREEISLTQMRGMTFVIMPPSHAEDVDGGVSLAQITALQPFYPSYLHRVACELTFTVADTQHHQSGDLAFIQRQKGNQYDFLFVPRSNGTLQLLTEASRSDTLQVQHLIIQGRYTAPHRIVADTVFRMPVPRRPPRRGVLVFGPRPHGHELSR